MKKDTLHVIPDYASAILRSRDRDVAFTCAVANFNRVYGGAVIREGLNRAGMTWLIRVIVERGRES